MEATKLAPVRLAVRGEELVLENNGYFDYCFMQEFEDDRYVNTFVDLLEQEGIYCTVSGPFDVHVPRMRLPDEPEE